jgi:hypothetical protein
MIALFGGLALVLVAYWIASRVFLGPSDPIVGQWRSNFSPQCDDAAGYVVVTADQIDAEVGDQAPKKLFNIAAIETDGDTHRLRIYPGGNAPPDFAMLVPYQLAGDTLTFGTVAWTPEALAKYPGNVQKMETSRPVDGSVGLILRADQPYHRCPG